MDKVIIYIYIFKDAFDRLKHYVNNIGNTSAKRTPSSGLDELVNDKSFNTCTFK